MSRYRHGGGLAGNVDAGRLTTLRSAIPGVASVTNPEPARGGVDPQSLQSVRDRSALEIRTRYRAVTAEDFEFLATEATPRVARAQLVGDQQPGVTLRLLPRIDPADRRLAIEELTPVPALLERSSATSTPASSSEPPVRLQPMRFRGVAVVVNLEASAARRPAADRARGEARPVHLPEPADRRHGRSDRRWLAGGSLAQPGRAVRDRARIRGRRVRPRPAAVRGRPDPGEQASKAAGRQIVIEPDEVIASGEHLVRVTRREP